MNQDKDYEGFYFYCGGTIAKYQKHQWIEWDKRTPRIASQTIKYNKILKKKK